MSKFAVIDSDTGLCFATTDTVDGVWAAIDAAQAETRRKHHVVSYARYSAAINARNLALIESAQRVRRLRRKR